jgi:MoxR-like ATPase
MQEKVVSIDRDQHPLPDLFMVLATMNPVEQLGTYPLSEAQLDRFIAKVELSYPARADEADLLHKKSRNFEALQKAVPQLLTTTQALAMQNHVAAEVSISDRVIAYLLEICLRTRPQSSHASSKVRKYITVGVSPRGGEHLIAFCKSRAFLQGRDFVSFEDVDTSAAAVLGHRLILSDAAFLEGVRPAELLEEIISGISPY